MKKNIHALTLVAFACAALAAGCGGRDEQQTPAAQGQTQTPAQQLNSPATVTGCLRAGDGPDTFVLTAAAANGASPATYQLAGNAGVNLRDHIGAHIVVSGVIREQQATTITSAAAPATDKAQGTTGSTPTVQTSATLQMRRMDVSSVSRADGKCE